MCASVFPSCPGFILRGSCHASEGFYSWSLTHRGMSRKWQQLESSDGKAHWQVLHVSTCQQHPACWEFPGKKKILMRFGPCCSKLCSLVLTPKNPHCKRKHSMVSASWLWGGARLLYSGCLWIRALVGLAISCYVEVREFWGIARSLEYEIDFQLL